MKKFLFFSYFLYKIPIFWDREFLFSYFFDPSCYLTPCYCAGQFPSSIWIHRRFLSATSPDPIIFTEMSLSFVTRVDALNLITMKSYKSPNYIPPTNRILGYDLTTKIAAKLLPRVSCKTLSTQNASRLLESFKSSQGRV